jgi:hypothetical protein
MYVVLQYSLIGGFMVLDCQLCTRMGRNFEYGCHKTGRKMDFFYGFSLIFLAKIKSSIEIKGYCVARKLAITGCKVKQVALRINSFDSQL